MRVNIYLSGKSMHTGNPNVMAVSADNALWNSIAESTVRNVSGGAPVFMATVEIPDNQLTAAPPVEVAAESVGLVAS